MPWLEGADRHLCARLAHSDAIAIRSQDPSAAHRPPACLTGANGHVPRQALPARAHHPKKPTFDPPPVVSPHRCPYETRGASAQPTLTICDLKLCHGL